jgi:hypothetical protein
MNGENTLLLEQLAELARTKSSLNSDDLDDLKARFLAITSCSPGTLSDIERLGYEPVVLNEDRPADGERSGLILRESGLLLSELLGWILDLPASAFADLPFSQQEFRAGILAVSTIVRLFEWSSFDAQHIQ